MQASNAAIRPPLISSYSKRAQGMCYISVKSPYFSGKSMLPVGTKESHACVSTVESL